MSDCIEFTVLGPAAPQGSMRGYVVKGTARVTSDNSKTMPYRQQVGWTALKARADAGHNEVFAGRHVPVGVSLDFWYALPPSAPRKRRHMAVKPDLDKLCRSTFDALSGILWNDDAQVVELTASKHYGLPERAEIRVWKAGA